MDKKRLLLIRMSKRLAMALFRQMSSDCKRASNHPPRQISSHHPNVPDHQSEFSATNPTQGQTHVVVIDIVVAVWAKSWPPHIVRRRTPMQDRGQDPTPISKQVSSQPPPPPLRPQPTKVDALQVLAKLVAAATNCASRAYSSGVLRSVAMHPTREEWARLTSDELMSLPPPPRHGRP